jgi:hypothetical protein
MPNAPDVPDVLYIRVADALTVQQWCRESGGVHYWPGSTADQWWLTPLGSVEHPSPWAVVDPVEVRDPNRIAVMIPKPLTQYAISGREIPGGVYLTIRSARRLHYDQRVFTARFAPAPVWVELDVPHLQARWYLCSKTLPLAGVKRGMEGV